MFVVLGVLGASQWRDDVMILDYQSDQEQGLCIGSGSVESTIKRIGVRIKISGAQWKAEKFVLHDRLVTGHQSALFSLFATHGF